MPVLHARLTHAVSAFLQVTLHDIDRLLENASTCSQYLLLLLLFTLVACAI